MRRIPDGGHRVRQPRRRTRILFAQAGGRNELVAGAHLPESLEDLALLSRFLFEVLSSSASRRRSTRC